MASFHLIPATAITLLLFFISSAPTFAGIGLVTDDDGDLLKNGRPYYLLPYKKGVLGSGGLSWLPNNKSSCPLYVQPKRYSKGTPATISTATKPTFVPISDPVSITFHDSNAPCPEILEWKVTLGEANDDKLFVAAGTSEPIPPFEFRIAEADVENDNEYYIQYCHAYETRIFSKLSIVLKCDELGFIEEGLLGVNPNKPVPFRFVKAFSDLSMPLEA